VRDDVLEGGRRDWGRERAGLPQRRAALRPGARARRRRLRSVSPSLSGLEVVNLKLFVFA